MNPIDRRRFLKGSLLSAAALSIPRSLPAAQRTAGAAARPASRSGPGPGIVDTNVHLFCWPTRHLKYGETGALVEKLRRHRVEQAWAGSFEGLLHKNIMDVNERLAEECRRHGEGLLVPFGTVNPVWPDWEEDLRLCHEVHRMPGIRLHPSYQNYGLDHPAIPRLIRMAAERGLIVQIAVALEDERVHHSNLISPALDTAALPDLLRGVRNARVQLLHAFRATRGETLQRIVEQTDVVFDISNLEGNGGIHRLVEGRPWAADEEDGGAASRMKVPVERLAFGSHAPYMPFENALLKLFESPLSAEQFATLTGGAARKLRQTA